MTVSVYSREAIERIIAKGSFPENTTVISFCDPELKHIDKDYFRVDYSSSAYGVMLCCWNCPTTGLSPSSSLPMSRNEDIVALFCIPAFNTLYVLFNILLPVIVNE